MPAPCAALRDHSLGGITAQGAASANSFQFTGRENDGDGLYYYRARYYDTTLSRFVSQDPTEYAGGPKLYAYVGNGPVFWVDPHGLNVTVTWYKGEDGNPFGHIGIAVNGNRAVGFDPAFFWTSLYDQGSVKPIAAGRSQIDSVTIPTSPAQDAAIQKYINYKHYTNPGHHELFGRNCATFAEGALRAGGVRAPDDTSPGPLMDYLEQMYGTPPNPFSSGVQVPLNGVP